MKLPEHILSALSDYDGEVTLSCLVKSTNAAYVKMTIYNYTKLTAVIDRGSSLQATTDYSVCFWTGALNNKPSPTDNCSVILYVNGKGAASADITIKAAKLELGEGQTLAHQDANGNWVLNEIPDYGMDLAKCKRYYRLWKTETARTNALQEVGLMRVENPAVGTIAVNGETLYYTNAEL